VEDVAHETGWNLHWRRESLREKTSCYESRRRLGTAPAAARLSKSAAPGLISVVICAHTEERWPETCAAVESARAQSFQNKEVIVVVDHNPALQTALAAALPDAMVVESREERGLSGARNTGVSIAQGDVVAFLDDDAVADPDWLKFLADSYADPAVIGVGGQILPSWQMPRPSWFPAEFEWVVGCTYRGMPESSRQVRNLIGANSSFRREAFGLAGGFRNGIGRSAGKRPLGCEETEFCIRISQLSPGSVFLFDDRAVVRHLVPANRCRFSYFHARCYAEGLSKAMVTARVGISDGLATERRYTTRTLPVAIARAMSDLLHGDWSGFGRASAIIVGFSAAAAGYAVGTASRHALLAGSRRGA
jgi:glucosyl-dolichyl phosphate glucuronosyltransferase